MLSQDHPDHPIHQRRAAAQVTAERVDLADQVADLQACLERPVEVIWVVHEGTANEYSLSELYNLVRGSNLEQWAEYTFFMDQTSADKFAERQGLLLRANKSLSGLSDENLAAVVKMIDEKRVDEVAKFLNGVIG
jgi:hypothetical protein